MSSCRWIPWAFVVALGVVVVVNGALAYFATSSSTGLVTAHPFDSGNSYNRVLAAAAAQDALGWHGAIQFAAAGAGRGDIVADLVDRSGKPLSGLEVTARLARPVEPLPDVVLVLAERGAGHYSAEAMPGHPGQWEVHVRARRGGDLVELTQRIVVK